MEWEQAPVTEGSDEKHGSETVTQGIRVTVRPFYLPDHSDPDQTRFVFGYRIHIVNDGLQPAKLLSRHWRIVDADGVGHDVEGEGVVGRQPDLEPGESFEYSSWCPLKTPWGTMEGAYRMLRPDGQSFDAAVRRFYLVAELNASTPA